MLVAEGGTEEANVRPRITQIMCSFCSQSLAYSQVSPNKLFPLLCCRLLPCSGFQNRMHSYAKWARMPGPSILFLLETRILKINICSSCEEKGKNGREELQGKSGSDGEAGMLQGSRQRSVRLPGTLAWTDHIVRESHPIVKCLVHHYIGKSILLGERD